METRETRLPFIQYPSSRFSKNSLSTLITLTCNSVGCIVQGETNGVV